MKIVINTLTLRRGGTERVIANLCNEFLTRKHDVTIITCAYQEPNYKLDSNIKHICLDKNIEQINQNKISRFVRRRVALKKEIEQIKPDIILSFLPEPNFLLLSLRKKLKMPLIISVRNDPKVEYAFLPFKLLMKKLYPKANGFVFQTEEAKNYFNFNKHILTNSTVIPNPINTDFIVEPYEGKREKIIVSVGRLYEQKNQRMLINAFSKISHEFKDYKLVIYGEGKLREELQQQISKLNLEDKVFLPGQRTNIKELIYKSSLFVLSSNYEGMPNSLMEAMALGLPVISTDCPVGGPRHLIQDGVNGKLIKVGCEDELAETMRNILSDENLAKKLGEKASEISQILEPNKIYSMWGSYIDSVFDSYHR